MKKGLVLCVLTLGLSFNAFAENKLKDGIDCPGLCSASATASSIVTTGPLWLTGEVFKGTSKTLQNNILLIQAEAVYALDSGVIGTELASVILAIREEMGITEDQMTDLQIVEIIVSAMPE